MHTGRDIVIDRLPPMYFKWTNGAMIPVSPGRARTYFVEGELYRLEAVEERASSASMRHFMATINESFKNIPEGDERFPSPQHLRRWALCKAGYCTQQTFDCANHEAALRLAAFAKQSDSYAITIVRETVVLVFTAESQSRRAMNKDRFEASKRDVSDVIARLLDIKRGDLPTQENL